MGGCPQAVAASIYYSVTGISALSRVYLFLLAGSLHMFPLVACLSREVSNIITTEQTL
jgi:hypothetical protein